jgi:hypothetical protein
MMQRGTTMEGYKAVGLTLRDYLAGRAMQSVIENPNLLMSLMLDPEAQGTLPARVSHMAYIFADSMVQTRTRRPGKNGPRVLDVHATEDELQKVALEAAFNEREECIRACIALVNRQPDIEASAIIEALQSRDETRH